MSMHRLHAVVHGRVQGVGYRYWAHHTAQRLPGVAGYVKNLPDGTVEVEAECPEKAPLDVLFHELHVGPDAAQVTEVSVHWEEISSSRFNGFRVS